MKVTRIDSADDGTEHLSMNDGTKNEKQIKGKTHFYL